MKFHYEVDVPVPVRVGDTVTDHTFGITYVVRAVALRSVTFYADGHREVAPQCVVTGDVTCVTDPAEGARAAGGARGAVIPVARSPLQPGDQLRVVWPTDASRVSDTISVVRAA